MTNEQPLWSLSKAEQEKTPLHAFMGWCAERYGSPREDYDGFHRWSVAQPEEFWSAIWAFCDVRGEPGRRGGRRPSAPPPPPARTARARCGA